MSQGVIYFNRGNKCTIRMLISMYALRKHYKGNLCLIAMGEQPKGFIELVRQFNIEIKYIEEREIKTLAQKTSLYRHTPYDFTVFIDADMICLNPIDEVFDKIKEHTYVTYHFEDWITTGGSMSKRIKKMNAVCPEYVQPSLEYGQAVNTGLFGFTKDAPILKELESLAEKTWRAGVNNVINDEVCCQVLLHKYPHYLMDREWGVSGKFGQVSDNTIFVHFHGKKSYEQYPNCHLYKQTFWELHREKNWDYLLSNQGLRRENRYLKTIRDKDLTIVTAVDRKYLPKLHRNFQKWVKTNGIMEHRLICFYDGDTLAEWELAFLGKSTKLVKWSMPTAESQREKMLSAFVFGAAEHVKTGFWIKLDADSVPVNEIEHGYKFELPVCYKNYFAVGHKCGYVKGKGFIKKLEEWGDTAMPKNERIYEHLTEEQKTEWLRCPSGRRFASYCCMYKTSFTKWLAGVCVNGRLPIPSEDSTTSYCLNRVKKPYIKMNMKQYFSPRG